MPSNHDNTDIEAGKGFLANEKRNENDTSKMVITDGRDSKFFRILPVVLYVAMVSGLGLMLSVYHFFVWDSTMPPVAKVPGYEIY